MRADEILILTVNWNSRNALELTLKSYAFWHHEGKPLPLLVIDNNSSDDSLEWMSSNKIPYLSLSANIGHMNAVNMGLDLASNYEWIFLIDCDVRFDKNVLKECNDNCLVYANLQKLFLGKIEFSDTIPKSWSEISACVAGNWWIKRLQPARCLMKWKDLKNLGISDYHPRGNEMRFFDLHADPGCYFYSELKRLGVEHLPFPEGSFHYELSSFRGDGTYPDRQFEIRENIPKDLITYKQLDLIGKFYHFSEKKSK